MIFSCRYGKSLIPWGQRRSQDFCLGGATRYIFRHLSGEPAAFSGGGVVAEIFRVLVYRIRFSGGGGSSRNFPCTRLPDQISGGGGSGRNFSRSQIKRIPSVTANFWYIFGPAAGHPPFIDDTHDY